LYPVASDAVKNGGDCMSTTALTDDRGELNFSSFSLYRNAIYGVAAIWIVLFHGIILPKLEIDPSLSFFAETCQLGNVSVDIFLLLSGIGLYFAYSKKPKLGSFYYKRVVRVYLPYLLIAMPFFVYVCFFLQNNNIGLFFQALFTVNYWTGQRGPIEFWYVSAILVFYLIYPLIYKFIFYKDKNALLRTAILVTLSIALCFILFFTAPKVFSFFDKVLPRFTVFIIGCYMGRPVKQKKKFSVLVLIASVIVVAAAYPLYARGGLSGIWRRYYGSLTGIALTFMLAQMFVVLSKIKLDKFFAFFGAFSLEIYIATIGARTMFYISPFYGGNIFVRYLQISIVAMLAAYLISLLEKPLIKLLMKPVQKK